MLGFLLPDFYLDIFIMFLLQFGGVIIRRVFLF